MEHGREDDVTSTTETTSLATTTAVSPQLFSVPVKPTARFAFLDGLRGIAALSIVIFHIWWYEPKPSPTAEHTPWLLEEAFQRTRGGVQILLVISGFVIAYTIRKTWFSWREMFLFIARRFVRLAPAYWLAITLVILVDALCYLLGDLPRPFEGNLSVPRVVAHVTFLQDIFGHNTFSAGIWTLCIEMQFYVVAMLTWGIAQQMFPRPVKDEPRPSAMGLFLLWAPISIISLFYWRPLESTEPYVIHFLWMFLLGMSAWWALDETFPHFFFIVLASVGFIEILLNPEWWIQGFQNTVALSTAIAIYVGGLLHRLDVWLASRPLQYFGRISYSLYLIHFPVSHLVTSIGWNWCDDDPTAGQAVGILLTAFFASLVAGHFLHVFVEVPTARWSTQMKQSSIPPTVPPAAVAKSVHQP